MIFTLFAADGDSAVIQSRVVVADRIGNQFWDVTSIVEDYLGLNLGQLSGYTGTCSSSQSPTLWRG